MRNKKVSIKVISINGWHQVYVDAKAASFFHDLKQIVGFVIAGSETCEVEIYDTDDTIMGYINSQSDKIEYSLDNDKILKCLEF